MFKSKSKLKSKLKFITGLVFLYLNTPNIFALNNFQQDSSKPEPLVIFKPIEIDSVPVSPHTALKFKTYDSPIRDCIKGDMILPLAGNNMLNYLFHENNNMINASVILSVQGWIKDKSENNFNHNNKICQINFSQNVTVVSCRFKPADLNDLMKYSLNPSEFNLTGSFAQILNQACQPK